MECTGWHPAGARPVLHPGEVDVKSGPFFDRCLGVW
jgi:hypothetical protein